MRWTTITSRSGIWTARSLKRSPAQACLSRVGGLSSFSCFFFQNIRPLSTNTFCKRVFYVQLVNSQYILVKELLFKLNIRWLNKYYRSCNGSEKFPKKLVCSLLMPQQTSISRVKESRLRQLQIPCYTCLLLTNPWPQVGITNGRFTITLNMDNSACL